MAYIVDVSASALAELIEIAQYVEQDSSQNADQIVQQVLGATDRLADFPYSGRVVSEDGYRNRREIIVMNFRVIYKIVGRRVEVTRIVRATRNLRKRGRRPK